MPPTDPAPQKPTSLFGAEAWNRFNADVSAVLDKFDSVRARAAGGWAGAAATCATLRPAVATLGGRQACCALRSPCP
jgi:hypothetical protein